MTGVREVRDAGRRWVAVTALVALLLSLVMVGPGHAQGEGHLIDYPRTQLTGAVSLEVAVPRESCRRICTSRSGCAGFDHAEAGGVCRVFAGVTGARAAAGFSAATRLPVPAYPMPAEALPTPAPAPAPAPPVLATPAPAPQPAPEATPAPPRLGAAPPSTTPATARVFNRFRNRDISSTARQRLAAQSVEQCEAACNEAGAWCVAYTFDAWNARCYLKDGSGELMLNARATTGVLTSLGTPPASAKPVTWHYFNDRAFPGEGFDSAPLGSRDACQNACGRLQHCIGFSWNSRDRLCRLHDFPQEYGARSGVQSGIKQQ